MSSRSGLALRLVPLIDSAPPIGQMATFRYRRRLFVFRAPGAGRFVKGGGGARWWGGDNGSPGLMNKQQQQQQQAAG